MTKAWRLDAGDQTLVLAGTNGRLAEAVYWGARLPEGEDAGALARAARFDLTGGALDAVLPLSICPDGGASFPGQPGISLTAADGTRLSPDLRLAGVEIEGGLTLRYADRTLGLRYAATFRAAGDVIEAAARIESNAPIRLDWLAAPVMPAPQTGHIIDWHGTWLREFHRQETPWSHGLRVREARTGRSGHEHPPVAMFPSLGATKAAGEVHALSFAWSGGHRFVAEELPDGRRQVQMGMAWGAERAAGTRFDSGTVALAFSPAGEQGIARAMQGWLRDRVVRWPDPGRPRPVHYNCWEAVYFDHSFARLSKIAGEAAALGAERFVLDDGWFGRRDDDTTSLGDWHVDLRKWPDGLGPLITHVQGLGMTFGLWVEPEMVNRDSDLARAHPDWVLGRDDQIPGRGQYALDMGRAEVRDHLFGVLDALLRDHEIDYLKWDHNRVAPHLDAAQTHGVYDLLDRLRAAHPAVEIESCASGGGRIDAGVLARTHRVWLSDSNDAIERLRMQHEAATWLPMAVTGSHVGPRRCHSSGRVLPMAFRAWVAAQRHMGFEMDPGELTEDEAAVLRRVTDWWKATRDWRMAGWVLPLGDPDPGRMSEMQVAEDGSRFVAFAGQHATPVQALPRPLRLAGLEAEARYEVRLANPEDLPWVSKRKAVLLDGPLTLSGAALMRAGLNLPVAWPATMWVVEGRRL